MNMSKQRDETFRNFAARVRGKAECCSYSLKCTHCERAMDLTGSMVKDVLIAGIYDLDICKDVLGLNNILSKSVNDIISLVESKKTARNVLPNLVSAMSSFKRQQGLPTDDKSMVDRSKHETAVCACGKSYPLRSLWLEH